MPVQFASPVVSPPLIVVATAKRLGVRPTALGTPRTCATFFSRVCVGGEGRRADQGVDNEQKTALLTREAMSNHQRFLGVLIALTSAWLAACDHHSSGALSPSS